MMTPICPRVLNLINDFVLLRFRARAPDDLCAIEVILLLLLLLLLYDEAMNSTNIAQQGQEEDEINRRELDRGAM